MTHKSDIICRMIEKYLFEGRLPCTEEMSEVLIKQSNILQRKKFLSILIRN